jgi:beta-mannosidase
MSEFGFQSFPALTTWEGALREEQLDTNAVAFRAHQKHVRGFALISEYIERSYPAPTDFTELTYLSQLTQSRGICIGIDAQRRSEGHCMGSLYWQLNDCWPAVSWSSIGFDGSWKALHYHLTDAFHPIHLDATLDGSTMKLTTTNHRLEASIGDLEIACYDLQGNELGTHRFEKVILIPNGTFKAEVPESAFGSDINPSELVARVKWSSPEVQHERTYTFGEPKDLNLDPQAIGHTISWQNDHFEIELQADHFHKEVWLRTDLSGRWSENFIDLLPHRKRVIRFYPESPHAFLQLDILSLNAFY